MANPRQIPVRRSAIGSGLAGLLLVLGSLAGSEACALAAPPVVLECWASGPPTAPVAGPWWVPLSLLNKPYETWDPKNQSKIAKEKLKEFKDMVAAVKSLGRSGRCVPPPIGLMGDGEVVTVQGSAANAKVVIYATVLSVEPGWDFDTPKVASLVRARIENVAKGTGLAVGQEIMYLRPWGVLKYDDTVLCTATGHPSISSDSGADSGETFDSSDQKVVVLGEMSEFNDSLIETPAGWEFKIVQGRFVSTAGYKVFEPAEFTLEDLIQSLKGK